MDKWFQIYFSTLSNVVLVYIQIFGRLGTCPKGNINVVAAATKAWLTFPLDHVQNLFSFPASMLFTSSIYPAKMHANKGNIGALK